MTGLEHTFIATGLLFISYYAGRFIGIKHGRIQGVSRTFDLMSDEEIERITLRVSKELKEED